MTARRGGLAQDDGEEGRAVQDDRVALLAAQKRLRVDYFRIGPVEGREFRGAGAAGCGRAERR